MEQKIAFYTGVGSRKTPPEILLIMEHISRALYKTGFVLRSGGAVGADLAFEAGAGTRKSIYLAKHCTNEACAIAKKYHPVWDRLPLFSQKLHGRNAFQVLGGCLDEPSKFLVCWTPDGCTCHAERTIATGGTGTAISIASENGVPVFNLQRADHLQRIVNFINKFK